MNRLFFILSILNIITFITFFSNAKKDDMIFQKNIINLTKENDNFRKVLTTASHSQIVLMSLKPGEDIGNEVHKNIDQILMFVNGSGIARIAGKEYNISEEDIFLVPAGTQHNFINTGKQDLKLFTIYAPAQHKKELTQKFKPK